MQGQERSDLSEEDRLSRSDLASDPIEQFRLWFDQARESETPERDAVALATVDADGAPSARIVLLKHFDQRGFVFFTNHGSRKARALQADPRASLLFHWTKLERQVRIEGRVEQTSAEESARYFATRSRQSRLAAWASPQSQRLTDRAELQRRYEEVQARFADADVPCPPFWGGFRLVPQTIEFWQGQPHRLHDRFVYTRSDDRWRIDRLGP